MEDSSLIATALSRYSPQTGPPGPGNRLGANKGFSLATNSCLDSLHCRVSAMDPFMAGGIPLIRSAGTALAIDVLVWDLDLTKSLLRHHKLQCKLEQMDFTLFIPVSIAN